MDHEGAEKVLRDLQEPRITLQVQVAADLEANLREVPRVYTQQTVRAFFNRLRVHCSHERTGEGEEHAEGLSSV